jgi:F420H(2)-dependent biliverdin reductase
MMMMISLEQEALLEFWTERHLCTLTTLRKDGSPHVVPVGATLDVPAGLVRVISSRGSAHVRHVAAGFDRVAICQVEGPRWITIEGKATVSESPDAVAEAVRRYAARYRQPRPNPERVVIEVSVTKVLGSSKFR